MGGLATANMTGWVRLCPTDCFTEQFANCLCRNDGLAAASSDGVPTVLEFLVINLSVCLVLLSNCYCIRFVVLLASDRLARSSKFQLISASY